MVAACLVMGNEPDKKANQWNCTGDMMNPYAIKRVNLSKSNGGGRFFALGSISCAVEFLLSKSVICIERNSSFCTNPDFLCDLIRKAVKVCATVSAIPPRT